MHRAFFIAFAIFVSGCQVPPEQLPLQPVPQNGDGMSYAEVVLRARLQAGAATEAFYVNNWKALADSARNIEESARLLIKTSAIPARQKDRLNAYSDELARMAAELRKAAEAEDVNRCTNALQRINLKVREMRPDA